MRPAFVLRNLALVNYYLYAQDFRFEGDGNAVFLGGNGSGKSMLLDAIQIVMTGTNKKYMGLNSRVSGGTSNSRTLLQSCLGKLDDGIGYERKNCLTYIALGFETTDGLQRCTAGVCIEAKETATDANVLGLFVAENIILGFDDFVDGTSDSFKEKNWQSFLDEQARKGRNISVYRREKNREFVRHLHSIINANSRGTQLDPDRARMAMRQALSFDISQIKSVTDFVRSYLLDDVSIKVDTFRERYSIWRGLQKSIALVEEEIETVTAIALQAERAMEHQFNARYFSYGQCRAEYDALGISMRKKRLELEEFERQHESSTSYLHILNENAEDMLLRLESLKRQLGGHDASEEIRVAKNRLDDLNAARRRASQDMKSFYDALTAFRHVAFNRHVGPFQNLVSFAQKEMAPERIGTYDASWPQSPSTISGLIKSIPPLDEALTSIESLCASVAAEREALIGSKNEAERNLAVLRTGGQMMNQDASAFLEEIARLGGEGKALSEVADIAPEFSDWRSITESLLADWVDAIIVEPEWMDVAYDLFEQKYKKTRVKLVQTETTRSSDLNIRPGSFAEIVITDNRHARAFINQRLGNRRRAASADDIRKGETASAMDGTSTHAKGMEHRRLQIIPRLGKSVRGEQDRILKGQIAEINAELENTTRRKMTLDAVRADIQRVHLLFVRNAEQNIATLDEFGRVLSGIEQQEEHIERLETQLPAELVAERNECAAELARLKTEIVDEGEKKQEYGSGMATCRLIIDRDGANRSAALEKLREEMPPFRLRRRRGTRALGMEAFLTRARQAYLKECEGDRKLAALREDFKDRLKALKTNSRSPFSRLEAQIQDYVSRHPDQHPGFEWSVAIENEETSSIHGWATLRLLELNDTILKNYKIQVESAVTTLVETMIQDFLSKLTDQLHSVEQTKNDLNKALKNNVFMGEVYQLRHERDQDKDNIRYLADRIDTIQPKAIALMNGTLAPSDGDYERLRDFVDLLTAEAADDKQHMKRLEEIADYRNYFRFSIDICDPTRDFLRISDLEQRRGTASGGQKFVPFYVCLGVASASSYRNHLGKSEDHPPQAGLVLMDEAFEKLDPENIEKIISFYKDLHLQLIMAAPKTHQALYQEKFDTLVSIVRVGRVVDTMTQHFHLAAHEMLRSENPMHKSRDYFAEILDKESRNAANI